MSIHVVALAEWTGVRPPPLPSLWFINCLETGDLKRTPGLLEAARWLIGAKKFYSSEQLVSPQVQTRYKWKKMTDS
ncbi:hypothetical protein Syun_012532 [Stephania yunnanensis]|uniref:Uncharacterized protein n=1 Tax=Stephania yunnanensis TaxID=152371 RepID=A0AAP0K1Z4_9MAGN